MTPSYLDHEGLIKARAMSWALTTGVQADELVSVGRSTFAKCAAKWDPVLGSFGVKGSFTSYLTVSLDRAFGDYTKKYPVVAAAAETLDVTLPCPRPEWHPRKALIIKERRWNLSEEARFVLETLLDCPMEAFGVFTVTRPKLVRGAVKRSLLGAGWSHNLVQRVFRELSAAAATIP